MSEGSRKYLNILFGCFMHELTSQWRIILSLKDHTWCNAYKRQTFSHTVNNKRNYKIIKYKDNKQFFTSFVSAKFCMCTVIIHSRKAAVYHYHTWQVLHVTDQLCIFFGPTIQKYLQNFFHCSEMFDKCVLMLFTWHQ